jgi:hypothetical protein
MFAVPHFVHWNAAGNTAMSQMSIYIRGQTFCKLVGLADSQPKKDLTLAGQRVAAAGGSRACNSGKQNQWVDRKQNHRKNTMLAGQRVAVASRSRACNLAKKLVALLQNLFVFPEHNLTSAIESANATTCLLIPDLCILKHALQTSYNVIFAFKLAA